MLLYPIVHVFNVDKIKTNTHDHPNKKPACY